MKREAVRDFLNLPGIAGVALMDGRSRPFFCGVDQTLNFQQKEALVQGIRQVVETTPEDFESFEFQFTGHQVYIYKLPEGIILLVLGRNNLVPSDYYPAVETIKAALSEDVSRAIATFRLIASDITMSGQNYWKGRATSTISNPAPTNEAPAAPPVEPLVAADLGNGTVPPPLEPPPTVAAAPPPLPDPPPPEPPLNEFEQMFHDQGGASTLATPSPAQAVELKDLLAALNHLSQFTTQYLGNAVIVNYWKSSRPKDDWLQNFQIDRHATLTFTGAQGAVTSEQQQAIQTWVATFIKRCSQVIRDFPALVDQNALDPQQKAWLLAAPPSD